jgi:hypothetical protein
VSGIVHHRPVSIVDSDFCCFSYSIPSCTTEFDFLQAHSKTQVENNLESTEGLLVSLSLMMHPHPSNF